VSTLVLDSTHVRLRAASVSLDMLAVCSLCVIGVGLAAITWNTWGDPSRDTGYDLVAASRVAHGDLPYVDFTYYYGPLAPMLLGLAARIGGDGLAPALVVGLLSAGLIVGLTYALARTFVGPLGSLLAALITLTLALAPTNFSYVLPHASAMTFGMAALLGTLIALARNRMLAAGVGLGLVALTKPELEAAAVAATVAWCLSQRPRRTDLLWVFGPAVSIPALAYGAFLTQVSLHTLVFDNLYPTSVLRAGGDKLLRLHAPLTTSSLVHHGEHVVLYAIGAGALLGLGGVAAVARRSVVIGLAIAGAAFCSIAFTHLEATRTALQLVYGWIPGGAAAAAAVLAIRFRRSADGLALSVALAVAGGTTYAAFYLLAPRAQTAVYFTPLVAVFLVALHLRALPRSRAQAALGAIWLTFLAVVAIALTIKDARSETIAITGPGGTIMAQAGDASPFRGALARVDALTRPGEAVLFAPQLSILYTLTDRRNPLRQISLLPGALADAPAERQALSQLNAAHVRVVVTDTHAFTEYGHGSFGASFDRPLATWIAQHFVHAGTFPGATRTLIVWRRSSS
jgi:hypothetical protein